MNKSSAITLKHGKWESKKKKKKTSQTLRCILSPNWKFPLLEEFRFLFPSVCSLLKKTDNLDDSVLFHLAVHLGLSYQAFGLIPLELGDGWTLCRRIMSAY